MENISIYSVPNRTILSVGSAEVKRIPINYLLPITMFWINASGYRTRGGYTPVRETTRRHRIDRIENDIENEDD